MIAPRLEDAGDYLGRAHFLRLQQQDRDVQGNPSLLREFQEILIGDPFVDAESVPATNRYAAPDEVFDLNAPDLPKLLEAEYLELPKIAGISKFRSAAGHDYSDSFEQTCSDIAVSINTPKGRKLVSYFDVMPDRLFERYRARGLASREAVIISKELRDADPLTCQDDKFTSRGRGQDWIALSRTR